MRFISSDFLVRVCAYGIFDALRYVRNVAGRGSLAPDILLGVERVLDGKSGWLFLITYTITMISNYYTGYMSTILL